MNAKCDATLEHRFNNIVCLTDYKLWYQGLYTWDRLVSVNSFQLKYTTTMLVCERCQRLWHWRLVHGGVRVIWWASPWPASCLRPHLRPHSPTWFSEDDTIPCKLCVESQSWCSMINEAVELICRERLSRIHCERCLGIHMLPYILVNCEIYTNS